MATGNCNQNNTKSDEKGFQSSISEQSVEKSSEAEDQVLSSLHYACMQISDDVIHDMENNEGEEMEFDGAVIAQVAFIVNDALETWSCDLQQLAKHAKRSISNADDVRMFLRRNENLMATLDEMCFSFPTLKSRRSSSRRSKISLVSLDRENSKQTAQSLQNNDSETKYLHPSSARTPADSARLTDFWKRQLASPNEKIIENTLIVHDSSSDVMGASERHIYKEDVGGKSTINIHSTPIDQCREPFPVCGFNEISLDGDSFDQDFNNVFDDSCVTSSKTSTNILIDTPVKPTDNRSDKESLSASVSMILNPSSIPISHIGDEEGNSQLQVVYSSVNITPSLAKESRMKKFMNPDSKLSISAQVEKVEIHEDKSGPSGSRSACVNKVAVLTAKSTPTESLSGLRPHKRKRNVSVLDEVDDEIKSKNMVETSPTTYNIHANKAFLYGESANIKPNVVTNTEPVVSTSIYSASDRKKNNINALTFPELGKVITNEDTACSDSHSDDDFDWAIIDAVTSAQFPPKIAAAGVNVKDAVNVLIEDNCSTQKNYDSFSAFHFESDDDSDIGIETKSSTRLTSFNDDMKKQTNSERIGHEEERRVIQKRMTSQNVAADGSNKENKICDTDVWDAVELDATIFD